MKQPAFSTVSRNHNNELDKIIEIKDMELNELAICKAAHNAKFNIPEPDKRGLLSVITSDIRAGYEKLISLVYQYNQPGACMPEAQLDGALAIDRLKEADAEIKKLDNLNIDDQRALYNKKPVALKARIYRALLITSVIGIGEIIFNTMAFQVIGDNLLFSLSLATSTTVAVFALAHYTAMFLKKFESRKIKILTATCSLLIASGIFIVMAYFRLEFMTRNGIYVSGLSFYILNICLFIVTALSSFFLMPSAKEITENKSLQDRLDVIKMREKEIKKLQLLKNKIKEDLFEKEKIRGRIALDTQYKVDLIQKKYLEAIAIYKCENIDLRKDGKVPVCFSEEVPPLNVNKSQPSYYQYLKQP